uniref:hypothetical protein n=1 Tax=Xanthomonas albilineans TaxID=29447 RepID=UPI0027DDA08E|nr:hypothetical protein [Xanthomonas albilineans]
MSAQLLQFPIRDKDQIKRLTCARRIAILAYLNVRSIENWMIEQNCSQDALNRLSELAAECERKNQWGNLMNEYEKYSAQNENKTWKGALELLVIGLIAGVMIGIALTLALI